MTDVIKKVQKERLIDKMTEPKNARLSFSWIENDQGEFSHLLGVSLELHRNSKGSTNVSDVYLSMLSVGRNQQNVKARVLEFCDRHVNDENMTEWVEESFKDHDLPMAISSPRQPGG